MRAVILASLLLLGCAVAPDGEPTDNADCECSHARNMLDKLKSQGGCSGINVDCSNGPLSNVGEVTNIYCANKSCELADYCIGLIQEEADSCH